MKKVSTIKVLCLLLGITLLLLSLSACGEGLVTVDIKPKEFLSENSETVADNQRYSLDWDSQGNCVLFRDKENGQVWSSVPYHYFLTGETNQSLNSPITISYYNPSDGSQMTAKAYPDCIERNQLSVSAENGTLTMNFYFEDAEILVPLELSLENRMLRARIRTENIRESGKTKLVTVSVLPYLCATENTDDRNSYLFLPVGSGALMYLGEEAQDISRSYTGEVYGTDASRSLLDRSAEEEPIRLPVFGVKAAEHALFAVIDEGAEAAKITADAGNRKNGYSTVYATFAVRGYDEVEVERTGYSDALVFSESFNKDIAYSVCYYPLNGESADYSGMAAFYRDYLLSRHALTDSDFSQAPYQITLLGGVKIRDQILGIPVRRNRTATNFDDCTEIIKELLKTTSETPQVQLVGFQKDGLDVGRIGGGYGYSSVLGGSRGYQLFSDYCNSKNISVFTEYDLIQYNQTGEGFRTRFDVARSAGNQLAAAYPLLKSIRTPNEKLRKICLLSRSHLEDAVGKLLKHKNDSDGVSLTTLGSMAYSDYSDKSYYVKLGTEKQVTELLKSVQQQHPVNVGSANGYAAAFADSVTQVSLNNGGYLALDESIPFYQMIFHGYTALYSTALNASFDPTGLLLSAVEAGVSPSFSICKETSPDFAMAIQDNFFYSKFCENLKQEITAYITKTADYYRLIENLQLVRHGIVNKGLTVSVFSDGTTVYVNHTTTPLTAEGIQIPARSFIYQNGSDTAVCDLSGGESS